MALLLKSSDPPPESQVSGLPARLQAAAERVARAHSAAQVASFQDDLPESHETSAVQSAPVGSTRVAADCEGCDIYVCTDMTAAAAPWKRFQETAEMSPFQCYEWLKHWSDRYAEKGRIEPYIVFVYQAGRLRMIVPLARETGALASRLIWLGHKVNDHNAPLVDPAWLGQLDAARAAALWHCITRSAGDADYLHLIRHPSRLGPHPNPFTGADPQAYSSNSHYLSLASDWPAFYQRLRGTKSRRRLREKQKKLGKLGKVRFRQVRGADEARATIATLLAWKTEHLENRGSRNPFSDGRLTTQLSALSGDADAARLMRVYVLEVDGRPVAATIALVHAGTFNFFIPAYDDTGIHNCSPGTIMLVKLIELAARAGLARFDFSLGDEAYKYEWCDTRVEITHQTEALTARGAVPAAVLRAGLSLKRKIKTSDRLLSALESVNAGRMNFMRRIGAAANA